MKSRMGTLIHQRVYLLNQNVFRRTISRGNADGGISNLSGNFLGEVACEDQADFDRVEWVSLRLGEKARLNWLDPTM